MVVLINAFIVIRLRGFLARIYGGCPCDMIKLQLPTSSSRVENARQPQSGRKYAVAYTSQTKLRNLYGD